MREMIDQFPKLGEQGTAAKQDVELDFKMRAVGVGRQCWKRVPLSA